MSYAFVNRITVYTNAIYASFSFKIYINFYPVFVEQILWKIQQSLTISILKKQQLVKLK